MQNPTASFYIRSLSDRARTHVVPAVDGLRIAIGTLNPLLSFHHESELPNNHVPIRYEITLLDGRNLGGGDFDFNRHANSGNLYLGSVFDSGAVNTSELLRVALFRMVGGLLEVVAAGDEHVIPYCLMQPAHHVSDLKFLAGVTVPLCTHCQDGILKFGTDQSV